MGAELSLKEEIIKEASEKCGEALDAQPMDAEPLGGPAVTPPSRKRGVETSEDTVDVDSFVASSVNQETVEDKDEECIAKRRKRRKTAPTPAAPSVEPPAPDTESTPAKAPSPPPEASPPKGSRKPTAKASKPQPKPKKARRK
eukprot:NODE_2323_length_486_cov_121.205950_g1905_i0.p1 GENE.NODE_2323_length_486_cov_121.205950_g1905_i0~~NODE_2323_length_486_cov_121.205950_g1905_i0.p1  ORF type:complete len:151 (+),score=46.63 NODE_2323_length_486_cov_121.205950_g1905_i0:26-454(+)